MTEVKNLAELQAAGQARSVPLTRLQLLESVAQYFDQRANQKFKAPLEIEHMELSALRAMSTDGHIFGEVEKAINVAGVSTNSTMGGVMDAILRQRAFAVSPRKASPRPSSRFSPAPIGAGSFSLLL